MESLRLGKNDQPVQKEKILPNHHLYQFLGAMLNFRGVSSDIYIYIRFIMFIYIYLYLIYIYVYIYIV